MVMIFLSMNTLILKAEGMGLTEMVLGNLKERYEEYAAKL